ncbi:aspartyl-phosphate phosphatase Spo0E family protein [Litchfieldia salsa]|uniref:Spo0E like sporulation regulatory protein n=1 Tax=Litchfieldia salsa TaxID=930152 RepID=A0A1H0UM69_9BACI|nr:aspartyl-phosphate phosphatase Spo0E family protein [Litchfieldia salsa]SDP67347.1 Spo0E like sporulation regulatory protein [Litchfieldia salsa]
MYNLKTIIESKRSEMISLAKHQGYTAPRTIQCSQELDKLITLHQKHSKNEGNEYIKH